MEEKQSAEKSGVKIRRVIIKNGKNVDYPEKPVKNDPIVAQKRKILFVASEARPFIATGGLADVIGSLPQALAKDPAYDIRVVLPLYLDIKPEYRRKFSFLGNIFVPLAWRQQYCGIFTYEENGVTYYFIDNEQYFKRSGCYGYFDDGERFAFFSRAVMEILPFIDFYPEVLHCHDWQTALAAIYLKTIYCQRPEYQFIRSLFTIHNIEYQGKYALDILEDLFGIDNSNASLLEYAGCINLMKGAIECSEKFSTVSPTYANEIKTAEYAHGLQDIIAKNWFKLTGILNGIDVDSYNPMKDTALFASFSADDLENKKVCKSELQKMLGLPIKDVPIIAMITRLVSHKGLELVKAAAEDILHEDVQFVLLGTGDAAYENYFRDLGRRYEGKASINIAFNGDLSRKIYSGADIFLMPSISEPCGLSQMIASRYATVPVVRETGGLFDSIKPYGNGGNGFTFNSCNPYDMLYVLHEAMDTYKNKEEWKALMKKVATTDFSWDHSAEEYKKLYEETLKV
ncbi:MAG: glycogen synthase GlgA [Clostridiales bacterium]|nr:glycogen synthase GlgA [Clostridiales bacterium]